MIDWKRKIERRLHAENDPSSHVEPDTHTFHPSQLSRCKRQCVNSKFGLEEHDTETLGTFKLGTIVHSWLEDHFEDRIDGLEMEKPVRVEGDHGIVLVGHTDAYDRVEGVVYDFKTRASWYKFDPPNESHQRQLALYADAVGAQKAQVVYLCKKNLEVKTWPDGSLWEVPDQLVDECYDKALEIREVLEAGGLPEFRWENPFDPCGCWVCGMEEDDE